MVNKAKTVFLSMFLSVFMGHMAIFSVPIAWYNKPTFNLGLSFVGTSLLYATHKVNKFTHQKPSNFFTRALRNNRKFCYGLGAGLCMWGLWKVGQNLYRHYTYPMQQSDTSLQSTAESKSLTAPTNMYWDGASAWIEPVFLLLRNVPEAVKEIEETAKTSSDAIVQEFARVMKKSFEQDNLSQNDVQELYRLLRKEEFGGEHVKWGDTQALIANLIHHLNLNFSQRFYLSAPQNKIVGISRLHIAEWEGFFKESIFGDYILMLCKDDEKCFIPQNVQALHKDINTVAQYELIGCVADTDNHSVAYLKDQYDKEKRWWYCHGMNRPNVIQDSSKQSQLKCIPQVVLYKKIVK